MARRKSSVMASMFRCTPSWLPVMAATRAAAMWPAVLIGSTGWPARWGAGVGVVFVSASCAGALPVQAVASRSEEHTSELQSLMRISYAVFCLKKKNNEEQKHKLLDTSHIINPLYT